MSRVRHIPVGGFYDRGKTRQNRAEAEAVVADVAKRLREREHPSIGIVTFSAAQQNIIDDLMQELFAKEPALEDNALRQDEPMFIKNLENVQGDERDVILFSVGYGPDAAGQVAMNFGPLNREGGWRRLNVAVSRARDEMVVFSTLRPEQLDMSRTRAQGVAGLKSFLEFAMRGAGDELAARGDDSQSGLAESVAEKLREEGYRVHLNVGFSKFKVDVAIVDPNDENKYQLGVLLDGPSYRAAETVRDRELSQSGVLTHLGWQLVRVYAIDWWEDPDRETKRILAALEKTEERVAPPPAPIAAARPIAAPKPVRDDTRRKYVVTGLPFTPQNAEQFVARPPTKEILRRLEKIVLTEGPIMEGMLIRRLLQSFDIARSGARIQDVLTRILGHVPCKKIPQGEETVYFPQDADPARYAAYRLGEGEARRDAAELPWAEVANAAKAVLRAQFGLSRADLVRETAKLFGYARLGANVVQTMEAGIALLIAGKEARQNEDGGIYLNESNPQI
jgi:hypothetical protein